MLRVRLLRAAFLPLVTALFLGLPGHPVSAEPSSPPEAKRDGQVEALGAYRCSREVCAEAIGNGTSLEAVQAEGIVRAGTGCITSRMRVLRNGQEIASTNAVYACDGEVVRGAKSLRLINFLCGDVLSVRFDGIAGEPAFGVCGR